MRNETSISHRHAKTTNPAPTNVLKDICKQKWVRIKKEWGLVRVRIRVMVTVMVMWSGVSVASQAFGLRCRLNSEFNIITTDLFTNMCPCQQRSKQRFQCINQCQFRRRDHTKGLLLRHRGNGCGEECQDVMWWWRIRNQTMSLLVNIYITCWRY